MSKQSNEHEHVHGEDCDCGHEHHHGGEHHHSADCGCGECHVDDVPGIVRTERKLHDEAIVISGSLTLFAVYETVRASLAARLEDIARAVTEAGGVVGHVKASADVTHVDMFSVTDTVATVKGAPESEIKISLAAIVFLVPPDTAETLVKTALEGVKADARR